MICLCGRAVAENLRKEVDPKTNNLTYEKWLDFSTDQLEQRIYAYPTFRSMVDLLLSKEATDAVDLLRSDFVGFLGNVIVEDMEEKKQADFLTAQGVLLKPETDAATYHMASPFVDSL